MFNRKSSLALAGTAALAAGMLLFIVGREFSSNWVRWVFGPLLWFTGCALLISWLATVAYTVGETSSGSPQAEKESSSKAVKRAG
ncbi:MAG TPA: hypothetical protein VFM10_10800 [Terriglobales bacterium]|jgi:hypothetical protein|nr:hypothetical protein [Terriglobales bacterium]